MTTGGGVSFKFRLATEVAANGMAAPSVSKMPKNLLSSWSSSSAASTLSVSPYLALRAIVTTMAKQIAMPSSSIFYIGSFRVMRAKMDIQNGLVDLQTTTKETGAIDTPKFISTNYAWPVKARHDNMYFLFDGNSLMAL